MRPAAPRISGAMLWLALAAMALRVLVPAGYMPGPAGGDDQLSSWLPRGFALTICTPDGPRPAGGKAPASGHGAKSCPFAGAVADFVPPAPPILVLPAEFGAEPPRTIRPRPIVIPARMAHAARAPPAFSANALS